MDPEAQLIIGAGPHAGTVFVVRDGELAMFGSETDCAHRLPGLAPHHAAVRYTGLFEVQGLTDQARCAVGERLLPRGQWLALRPGDVLHLGPHDLRVELLGLSASTLVGTQGTRRLGPEVQPAAYELEGRLGGGAFGTVYAARRLSDGLEVALKILRRQPNPVLLARFEREFAACRELRHPNIVRVLDQGVDEFPPYVAMERVPGQSANDLIRAGALPVERALHIGHGVAQALVALAEARLVHRDIKPANVLVTPDDVAKLADFGLVKDMDEVVSTLTATGVGLGTLAYAAPEQLRNAKEADLRADVYGLAATLFELVAGRVPIRVDGPNDVLKLFHEVPLPLRTLAPDCPVEVEELIADALRKDPRDRPDGAAFAAVLGAARSADWRDTRRAPGAAVSDGGET